MPNWKEWDPCEADEQVSEFPKLVRLHIRKCLELLGRLPSHLHSLQKLEIKECRRLVVSISNFPSLCEIKIKGCEKLVDTCSDSGEVIPLQKVCLTNIAKFNIPPERIMSRFRNSECIRIDGWKELASLSQSGLGLVGHCFITIENCPQLVSLETEEKFQLGTISCIERLKIENCEKLNLNRLPKVLHALRIDDCSALTCLFLNAKLPMSLNKLKIWTCPELECIAQDLHQTSALQSIQLWHCDKIKSLPRGLHKLSHLEETVIIGCPNLISFEESGLPTAAANLRVFSAMFCEKFEALPKCILYNFTSLQKLTLRDCSADISFPEEDFPTNLTKFVGHLLNGDWIDSPLLKNSTSTVKDAQMWRLFQKRI